MKSILPKTPFEIIALSMSGGGYRATAFHLGTLTYLDRINFKNKSLLERVKILSTVSGGTFTGVEYAAKIQQGKSLKDAYKNLYRFMNEVNLVEVSLDNLSVRMKNFYKTSNVINAFAEAYYQYLIPEKFGVFWNDNNNHLDEIIFNATDFTHGIAFRFQKTKHNRGVIGNYYSRIEKKAAKEIRLADIIASSSCFPGGFEPLKFPNDYRHDEATEFNKYADKILKEKPEDFPMGIMDGGIYDNQGIDSVILANDRMKDYKEYAGKEHPIDLYIISDVSSPFMKPLKMEVEEKKSLLYKLSFKFVKKMSFGLWIVAILLIAGLIFFSEKLLLIGFTLLLAFVVSFGVFFTFTGNLLLKKVPNWFDVPKYFMSPLHFFNKIKFGTYYNLVVERKDSVVKMTSDVFMKQIRRLSYKRIYENPNWKHRTIMNAVYEMSRDEVKEETEKRRMLLRKISLKPSELMVKVSKKAALMDTTLWFEPKQLNGADNHLNSLIATGQFNICFNLIEYIQKLKSNSSYSQLDDESKRELDIVGIQLRADWHRFNEDPFWLQKEWNANP